MTTALNVHVCCVSLLISGLAVGAWSSDDLVINKATVSSHTTVCSMYYWRLISAVSDHWRTAARRSTDGRTSLRLPCLYTYYWCYCSHNSLQCKSLWILILFSSFLHTLIVWIILRTKVLSNLWPTTRKCLHLVAHVHFRSCDKDGGHTIQSATVENPLLHANFMAICFIEAELWPIRVLLGRNRDFRLFAPVTLTLTRWPYTNLTRIPCRYIGCVDMNFLCQCFRK